MIKLDIVNLVAEKTGVPKQKAEQVVDSLFEAMKEALAKGKRIELRGFGVLSSKLENAASAEIRGPARSADPGGQDHQIQARQRTFGKGRSISTDLISIFVERAAKHAGHRILPGHRRSFYLARQ